ncbi:MAG: DNA polymerase III subunit beta [Acidobacteria bacterium]|nr:DNA polymerase III subunit beta [Acidobacteriota bacterium]
MAKRATKGMRFKIKVQTLLGQLALMSGIEDRRTSIPVLHNLSIVSQAPNTIKLTATDLDVTLTCQAEADITEPGSILVPLKKLLDITKTLPKIADITFQALEQGGAQVTCERASFKLVAPEFESFPELPKPCEGAIQIPASTVASMITSTIFAITDEASRYTLSGAKVEIDQQSLRMVTTDGHRLAKSEDKTTTAQNPIEVLIPEKALAALGRLCAAHDGPVTFAADENHAHFNVGSSVLTARLLYGQFPDYKMVFPKDNTRSFTADVALFRDTLRRVSLMADERSHSVRLDVKNNGTLTIIATNSEGGQAVEDLPINLQGDTTTPSDDVALSIGFNGTFVLEALASINADQATMTFKDANSQVMIIPTIPSTIEIANVVMPMRI